MTRVRKPRPPKPTPEERWAACIMRMKLASPTDITPGLVEAMWDGFYKLTPKDRRVCVVSWESFLAREKTENTGLMAWTWYFERVRREAEADAR